MRAAQIFLQSSFRAARSALDTKGSARLITTTSQESHGAQSMRDLAANNPGTPVTLGEMIDGNNASGAKTYYKDLGPRVGFAYAPSKLFGWLNNTVVRGGYSIYYAALSYSDFGNNLQSGTSARPDFLSPDNFTAVQSPDQGFPSLTPPSNNQDPTLNHG